MTALSRNTNSPLNETIPTTPRTRHPHPARAHHTTAHHHHKATLDKLRHQAQLIADLIDIDPTAVPTHAQHLCDLATALTTPHTRAAPRVRVLGSFHVTAADGTSPQWTSRKARELLKHLIARRGNPVPRETLMHELWPDIHPHALGNRYSVALSTIRRALDPQRTAPPHHHLINDRGSVRLNLDTITVDVEQFLPLTQRHDLTSLRRATQLYTGDAFADEPYADWAHPLRHEAQTAFCAAAHRVAAHDQAAGEPLAASELYRRILDIEPLDTTAHDGLIACLTALGAEGQANAIRLQRDLLTQELAS